MLDAHRVLVIQPACWLGGDEELTAVGVGASIGHGHSEGSVVAQVAVELILELASPDALPSRAVPLGIPHLDHKVLDNAVDPSLVVVPVLAVSAASLGKPCKHHTHTQDKGDINTRVQLAYSSSLPSPTK